MMTDKINADNVSFTETETGVMVVANNFPYPPYNTINFNSMEEAESVFKRKGIMSIDQIKTTDIMSLKLIMLAKAGHLLETVFKNH